MNPFPVVVITGAANGIGKALTHLYLLEGSEVWGIDKDKEALDDLDFQSRKYARKFIGFVGDVTDEHFLQKITDGFRTRKIAPSLWINNAGVSGLGAFQEQGVGAFESVIRINLLGTVSGTRCALQLMEPFGKGTILNIASAAGFVPVPYLSAYCASKSGVVAFSKAIRKEMHWKNSPIRIALASPGFVDTQMVQKSAPEGFPKWLEWTLVSPETVAKQIYNSIAANKLDIFPTWNGKMIYSLNRLAPSLVESSTRFLLTKTWKDLILGRLTPPARR